MASSVPGQDCGELDVSTPETGTDGPSWAEMDFLKAGAGMVRSVGAVRALTILVFAQVHILEKITPKSN